MKRASYSSLGVAALLCLWATQSHATVFANRPSLKEVAEHAEALFVGKVSAAATDLDGTGKVWTLYTFDVEQTLAGKVNGKSVALRCIGGSAGGRSMRGIGFPLFSLGERVVIFANRAESPDCQFSGLELGVFRFAEDERGREILVDENGYALVSLGEKEAVKTKVKRKIKVADVMPPSKAIYLDDEPQTTTLNGPPGSPETLIEELRHFAGKHAAKAKSMVLESETVVRGPQPKPVAPPAGAKK